MQQKPYYRQERFLSEERPLLSPLPENPFLLKRYRRYTVAKNGHIYMSMDRHYYSVPYRWIGRTADVIYTTTLVSIYVDSQCVTTHIRSLTPGEYTTVKEHLASHHQHWSERSPAYYLQKAGEKSTKLVSLFEGVFAGNRPAEHHYRTCDGLLSLQRKTPDDIFSRALNIALDNSLYSYRSVLNLISNDAQNLQIECENKPLPKHDNIRGKAYYNLFDNNPDGQ